MSRDRTAFGRAIGDFQGMRWKLAEMYREIEAGAQHALPRLRDAPTRSPTRFWRRSPRSLQRDGATASPARRSRCMAAYGFTDEYPVSRFYRGARYGTLGGGTTETLRDLIGKRIMDAAETGAELLAYDMMSADCGN